MIKDCNKIIFTTRSKAKRFLKGWNKGNRDKSKLTDVYYCELCRGFHVTSKNKKQNRTKSYFIQKFASP